MSKIGISIRLDVTKIEKARLYKGAKGTYLDVTTFIDLDNQDEYGNNGFVAHSVSKEEREQNVKGAILGNAKVFFKDNGQPAQSVNYQNAPPVQQHPQGAAMDDDIPFMRLDSF